MHSKTTVSTLYIRTLFQALQGAGMEEEAILRVLNITPAELEDANGRIPIQRLGDMWQQAIEVSKLPLLGLLTGSHVIPADYGIIGHVALASNSLADAFYTGIKYEHLINDSYETELIEEDDIIYNRLHCNDLSAEQAEPLIEFDFAAFISFGRAAAAKHEAHLVKPVEVHFKHSPRGAIEEYERLLFAPVKFNMPHNQVAVHKSILELSTRAPDPSLLSMIQQRIQTMDEAYNSSQNSTSKQVSRFVLDNIELGFPTVEQIAESLNISASTLKRRLTKEGASYQALISTLKRELAESFLKEETPIADIAMILGFSETSAFTRAFKKWTGVAPSQFGK